MNLVPTTSVTLLMDLASDAKNVRWAEFVSRYKPMMVAYLRQHYPTVDADDVIAETLIALCDVLKSYRYDPATNGRFHNYLIGVLKHKAGHLQRAEQRYQNALMRYTAEQENDNSETAFGADEDWRKTRLSAAIAIFTSDVTVQERTKQAFLRTTIQNEPAESVAKSLGVKRNAVDQMKSRAMTQLRGIIAQLQQAERG